MNVRTLLNVVVLGALVYGIFCAYQYIQLRNAITSELQGKTAIRKVIGDLSTVKIGLSQSPGVSCESREATTWKEMVFKYRSEGCFRLSLGLQSDSSKTMNLALDYDTEKLIGNRISYVMMCNLDGSVIAKDNGLPRTYQNCH